MSRPANVKTILLVIGVAVAAGALWLGIRSSASSKSSTTQPNTGASMKDRIEETARKVKGADEAAVRELADAVFEDIGASIPSLFRGSMKERLVRAELKYRSGKKGTSEANIVRTVNRLADALQAPAYAQTSALQVRILRVELMKVYPSFIAEETDVNKKGLKKKVGDKINPDVSPLEAFYITATMLQQKMLNGDWQETPEEFQKNLHKKEFMRPARSTRPKATINPPNTGKRREMAAVVERAAAKLSNEEALSLVEATLTTLGIAK